MKPLSLDPQVVIYVREVVLSGRERTVPKDGKVLLLVHGATVPGHVGFDIDFENCSMMRYFAHAGWDTFTFDIEGYGRSTRPLVMDDPSAFPESKAPIHTTGVRSPACDGRLHHRPRQRGAHHAA
jgi:pimeloyl-ACP methyl ester carboxylesterase